MKDKEGTGQEQKVSRAAKPLNTSWSRLFRFVHFRLKKKRHQMARPSCPGRSFHSLYQPKTKKNNLWQNDLLLGPENDFQMMSLDDI